MKISKILMITMVLLSVVCIFNNVFAFGSFDLDKVDQISDSTGKGVESANKAANKVWGTAILILQMLAVAAIIIAGVRYMFAAPDAKADIKKQTVGLVVGAILVFAASGIVGFLVNVTNEVTSATIRRVNSDGTIYRYSNYDGDAYNDWDNVINPDAGVADIFEQDSNDNNVVDFYDLWIKDHPEDKELF